MKQLYETPKAEKLEFDYTDAVTASGGRIGGSMYSENARNCAERITTFRGGDNGALDFLSGIGF